MDTIRCILFENPFYLVPILGIGVFVFVRIWATKRTPTSARLVWLSLVVAVGLLVLQDYIKTDREKVIASCRTLIKAAEAGNIPGIGAELSPGFQTEGMNKDEILAQITRALTHVKINKPKAKLFEVTFENPNLIKLAFTCSATITSDSWNQPTVSRWHMWYERVGDGWKVIKFIPVRTPLFPVESLRELVGIAR